MEKAELFGRYDILAGEVENPKWLMLGESQGEISIKINCRNR